MQRGRSQSIQGVLFDARFKIVQITVSPGEGEIGYIDKTPSDRSCIVLAIA